LPEENQLQARHVPADARYRSVPYDSWEAQPLASSPGPLPGSNQMTGAKQAAHNFGQLDHIPNVGEQM